MQDIESFSKKNIFKYLKILSFSVSIGFIVTLLSLFGFAFLVTSFDIPESLVNMFPIFAGIIGAFGSGLIAGKIGKNKGIMYGLSCGIIISLIILLATLLILKGTFNTPTIVKFISITVGGMIGGVLGVNSKK